MRTIRPASACDCRAIQTAIDHLRAARGLLADSGAPRAAAAVRRALRSAKGAARHAEHRLRRSQP